MKFTKYNNPAKKKIKKHITKAEYIPTLQELNYCYENNVKPDEYVNIKFSK